MSSRHRQKLRQQPTDYRHSWLPTGDESSIGSCSRRSSCQTENSDDDGGTELTGALNDLRVQCPNCAHCFPLSEGLLVADPDELEPAAPMVANAAGADTTAALEADQADFGGPCGSLESLTNDFVASYAGEGSIATPVAAEVAAAEPAEEASPSKDDAKTSQPVSRCYQILNWTVEQLEKVICDPKDRRIRKISSITQCDIEVRSEKAQSVFGAAKNYCILRASQPINIEKCQGLLRRQMMWVMKPKAQDSEIAR